MSGGIYTQVYHPGYTPNTEYQLNEKNPRVFKFANTEINVISGTKFREVWSNSRILQNFITTKFNTLTVSFDIQANENKPYEKL